MLRKETVSDTLFEVLSRLMVFPELENHRLVGGTALALQIGHRISVDIDLFSGQKSDYQIIEKLIFFEFGQQAQLVHYINSPLGSGLSFLIMGVKVDLLDWEKDFGFAPLEVSGIRMAAKEEIAGMKLDILTSPPEFIRFEKKDFVDIAFLLEEFSLHQLIQIYKQRNPGTAFPERLVPEALQLAEMADKKPNPRMLSKLDWPATKAKINTGLRDYLGSFDS